MSDASSTLLASSTLTSLTGLIYNNLDIFGGALIIIALTTWGVSLFLGIASNPFRR